VGASSARSVAQPDTTPDEGIVLLEPDDLGTVDDFTLFDLAGDNHQLSRHSHRKAVVLVSHGIGCPIVRLQMPALAELAEEHADDVTFLLLAASPQDEFEDLLKDVAEFEVPFPVLRDDAQLVSRDLGIRRTAEAIVVEPTSGRILYRGVLDDRLDYGAQKKEATEHYLADALADVALGRKVRRPWTKARGCLVFYEGPDPGEELEVSYSDEVAPLLVDNCIGCHRPGGIAPFAFTSYRKARGWSPMMREVIRTKRMPPWGADSHHGTFQDDMLLAPEEARTLVQWAEAGAPRGEGPDPLAEFDFEALPRATDMPFGELGEPDLIVELPFEVPLPATGLVPYIYGTVPAPFEEDRWLKACAVLPGNERVVHHAFMFLRYPPERADEQPDYGVGVNSYFAAYAPGQQIVPLPEGTGALIPGGSGITFQLHYVTTGREETDRTRFAMWFHDEQPDNDFQIESAWDDEFVVPAGVERWPYVAEKTFEQDVILYELFPHMHYRGRTARYDVHWPDGRVETLLSIPRYDFTWQLLYRLEEPLHLPAGTKVVFTGSFDNSERNPLNPDPTVRVPFGLQSEDEMFIGYLGFARQGRR
jgi:hypothetical protein